MGQKQKRGSLMSVGAIVGHPLRAKCWSVLAQEVASPSDIAGRYGERLDNVSYHVDVLRRMGVIELVAEKQVRGAVQHYYRALRRNVSDDDDTASRPLENRLAFARSITQMSFADAYLALESGTFCERPDHAIVRYPLLIDEEGWSRVRDGYRELFDLLGEVQEESALRLGADLPGIRTTAVLMFFERPEPRDENSSG